MARRRCCWTSQWKKKRLLLPPTRTARATEDAGRDLGAYIHVATEDAGHDLGAYIIYNYVEARFLVRMRAERFFVDRDRVQMFL